MTANELIFGLNAVVYLTVFARVVAAARRPTRMHVDIALLFSVPAFLVVLGTLIRLGLAPAALRTPGLSLHRLSAAARAAALPPDRRLCDRAGLGAPHDRPGLPDPGRGPGPGAAAQRADPDGLRGGGPAGVRRGGLSARRARRERDHPPPPADGGCPDGGAVLVTLRDGGRALISVAGQGVAIPEADLPHVFERFFRGANSDDRRFPGMGLGLFIYKSIVEGHGGTIGVRSQRGRGTTFQVALPLVAASAGAAGGQAALRTPPPAGILGTALSRIAPAAPA